MDLCPYCRTNGEGHHEHCPKGKPVDSPEMVAWRRGYFSGRQRFSTSFLDPVSMLGYKVGYKVGIPTGT